mgnify:FL=1
MANESKKRVHVSTSQLVDWCTNYDHFFQIKSLQKYNSFTDIHTLSGLTGLKESTPPPPPLFTVPQNEEQRK